MTTGDRWRLGEGDLGKETKWTRSLRSCRDAKSRVLKVGVTMRDREWKNGKK